MPPLPPNEGSGNADGAGLADSNVQPAKATATAPWLTLTAGRGLPPPEFMGTVGGARASEPTLGAPLGGVAFGPSAFGPTGFDATLGGTIAADAVIVDAGARAARPPPVAARGCERIALFAFADERAARGGLAATTGAAGGVAAGTNVVATAGVVDVTSGDSPSTRSAGRARCAGRFRRDGVAERAGPGTDGGGGGARAGGGTTTVFTDHEVLLAAASGEDATDSVARVEDDKAEATFEAGADGRTRGTGTAEDGEGADVRAGTGTQGREKEAGAGAGADEEEDAEYEGETDKADSDSNNPAGKRPRVLGGVWGSPETPLNIGGGVAVRRWGTRQSATTPREGLGWVPEAK